jgi:hypothetical protein
MWMFELDIAASRMLGKDGFPKPKENFVLEHFAVGNVA